jgi:hypothetical protein
MYHFALKCKSFWFTHNALLISTNVSLCAYKMRKTGVLFRKFCIVFLFAVFVVKIVGLEANFVSVLGALGVRASRVPRN